MGRMQFKDLVLWESEDYIAINKPPFIASLDDRNDEASILSLARGYHEEAQLCHRLDKETSGVLIIAKHPEAYRHLSLQFEDRKVEKTYYAVVDGIHDFKNTKCERPIYKLSNGTVKIDARGKRAVTYITTMKAFKQHSLVSCQPVTGRMHQIRIHLSSLQAPITGDLTYGGRPFYLSSVKRKYNLKKGTEEQPLIKRLALHARHIKFKGLKEEVIEQVAPEPKDFKVLVKQLDKNS
ncbi:MAG: RNA pseudouridine synthase [Fulvivirga sp.]|nr:RNA pseudouridine synthase [Fulvivirga sp.]